MAKGLREAQQVSGGACLDTARERASESMLRDGEPEPKKRRVNPKLKSPEVFEEGLNGLPERLGDNALRLIIVGTNPSGHAWKSGHYYSNPSNHMWRILRETGIAPPSVRGPQDDLRMPEDAGVGFVDLGCGTPGTHLSKFTSEVMQGWAATFYQRLSQHQHRARQSSRCTCGRSGAPQVVAFAGKRQWMELMNVGKSGKLKLTRVEGGVQLLRPKGWPYPSSTEVWVMPSTSGAAAMTHAQRYQPYMELGQRLKQIQWPLEQHSCQVLEGGT